MHIKIGFVLYMKIPEKPLINMAVELMGKGHQNQDGQGY